MKKKIFIVLKMTDRTDLLIYEKIKKKKTWSKTKLELNLVVLTK